MMLGCATARVSIIDNHNVYYLVLLCRFMFVMSFIAVVWGTSFKSSCHSCPEFVMFNILLKYSLPYWRSYFS